MTATGAGSRHWPAVAAFAAGICLASFTGAAAQAPSKGAVLETYADIAHAAYEDSLSEAKNLRSAIQVLVAAPSPETLAKAREAWVAARVPYMQTEAYRFGNAIVDDWEGKVNAWPLDEGLIDYVDASYGADSAENPLSAANVIAGTSIEIGGETVDTSTITKDLLADSLQEAGGVEANVATGYHAVEFLLWGQDLNGTGAGAGDRSWTDFATDQCTNGHCERRAAYLTTAADLLVDDLAWMTDQWAPGGDARAALTEGGEDGGIAIMMTGLGSLSYGELAGERMQLGLLLHDPEEEHDCFSDMTHLSHMLDHQGMVNVYRGSYTRTDGSVVEGASLSDLVAAEDAAVDAEIQSALDATTAAMAVLGEQAEAGVSYDQLIAEGNDAGNAQVQAAIDALTDQTRAIEKGVAVLGLEPIAFEGSDSLDDPEAVFQ